MTGLAAWTVKDEHERLRIDPWLVVSTQTVVLPDGREVADFVRIAQPAFAVVFGETDDGRVIVLRHYRHGVGRVCLSFPGGHLNTPDEAPETAAARELMEETGFTARRWVALGSNVTNANAGGAVAHFFRAEGCRKVAEANSGDLEEMEILLLSVDAVIAAAQRGEFAVVNQMALLALATHPLLRGGVEKVRDPGYL